MTTHATPFRKSALAIATMLVAGIAPMEQALGATCTWIPGSGNWNAVGNWSCGVVPGAADTATIAVSRTVMINDIRAINTLINAGSFNIDAFLLTLAAGGSITNTGTINSRGSSALVAFSNAASFLSGVTLNGTLDTATNADSCERIVNSITVNDTVDLNNGGIPSAEGNGALGGTGKIVFGNAAGNRVDLDGSGATTLGSGITIRGEGAIGNRLNIGGTKVLVNNGKMSADVAGGTITIIDSAVTNNGTLEAKNGATLVLASNVSGGAARQIVAGAGSKVLQSGIVISGAVNATGSGNIRSNHSASNFLSGVTSNGKLDMASVANSRERIAVGGLVLNSVISISEGGVLSFEGDGMLSGAETTAFGSTGNRLALGSTGTTTIASSVTVRGENGTLGVLQSTAQGSKQALTS